MHVRPLISVLFYNVLFTLFTQRNTKPKPMNTISGCTLTTAATDREHLLGSVRYQVVRISMSTRINKATRPISWMSLMI